MRACRKFSGVWEATPTWYTVVIIAVNGSAVFKRLVSRCVHVICLPLSRVKNRTSPLKDNHWPWTPSFLTFLRGVSWHLLDTSWDITLIHALLPVIWNSYENLYFTGRVLRMRM